MSIQTGLPAVVSILQLGSGTLSSAAIVPASMTVAGVATTLGFPISQIATTIGLPTGGGTGQILNKLAGADFSTQWSNVTQFVAIGTGLATSGSATSIVLSFATQTGLSVLGVGSTATAVPAAIGPGTAAQVLVVNDAGTGVLFGQVNLASSAAIKGVLPGANMSAVNLAASGAGGVQGVLGTANMTPISLNVAGTGGGVQNVLPVANGGQGTSTLTAHAVLLGEGASTLGFATIGTGGRALIDQGAAADPAFKPIAGDLALASTGTATIAANAVTYAKFQQEAASSLVGNPTNALANVQAVGVGGGLTFGGAALLMPGGLLNVVRNGTLDIWQRGTGTISVGTGGAYTADGFIVTPTGASCTVTQAINNRAAANSLFALAVIGSTSVTDATVTQRIESNMAAAIAGKTVTFQAQVFNNTGASFVPTLATRYATTADTWSSSTQDLAAANLQTCSNGAWTQVAYTFNASANGTTGYEFIVDFGNNLNSSTKDVLFTEVDLRVTPNVATGLNAAPPPPEIRQIPYQLAACQRYFVQFSEPALNVLGFFNFGIGVNGTTANVNISFLVPMRTAPTIGIAVGSFKALATTGGGVLLTSLSSTSAAQNLAQVVAVAGTGFAAAFPTYLLGGGGGGFIQASAEL